MSDTVTRASYRLRDVVLDVGAYTLRRHGRVIRLERQPMELLILLVQRRGQLVTRAEIVDLLWGKDVFVDVETGVHTAIRKIRQALRDPTDAPTFIETVPGKGYRFVAPVETVTAETVSSSSPSPRWPVSSDGQRFVAWGSPGPTPRSRSRCCRSTSWEVTRPTLTSPTA